MIKLNKISTNPPSDLDRDDAEKQTKKWAKRIGELQNLMLAEGKHSLLVIFQGMDGSGKDGAVKKVFNYCHHGGVKVHSFKKPSDEQFAHDFLWRVHQNCPEKGMIQIFNRSHYEDILVQRVHGWIDEERVQKRMDAINAFEDLLQFDNNTLILKFYLHISYEQQEVELQQRLDEAEKYWKHNDGDWEQRKYWDKYMTCYEYAINNSTIPWHIIPVDSRWYRDYTMSKIVMDELENLNMKYPKREKE
ncbi:MAG: PPK2 family polyphosphate:nucleotide phosphotransferase [Maribacter sp.]|jgi:PPK2 family polyphosphate:nucleotide phosphotransferase